MNKLLVALIAGAFASVAAAQTAPAKPTTKERQADVKAATQEGSVSSAGVAATAKQQPENVKASKETAKMTTAEKNQALKEVNKQMVNPDNPSGSVATTAASQKANVDASKGTPKANVELKTKEGQKQLDKGLQKASTP
jgi:hypothetical protein